MKKQIKTLAFVMSVIMSILCFTIEPFAASYTSSQHYVSISTNKTKGLKQGEIITVEIRVDSTADLCAFEYKLNYDPNVFEVDTTYWGSSRP